jgi:hypothetical protein
MTPARIVQLLSSRQRLPASIASLYANAEPGDVWLPHFSKYAFQDAAMTIPAVVGGPVVKMVGMVRGIVATFANVTLQQDAAGKKYLAANGTSSAGSTPAIDFTGTDKMTIIVGAHKASDAAIGSLLELSPLAGPETGIFAITAPNSAAANVGIYLEGSTATTLRCTTFTAPVTTVLSVSLDIAQATAATEIVARFNGAAPAGTSVLGAADAGTGNFGNYQHYFFARAEASLFFNGRFYGEILRGAASSAGQMADADAYMRSLTGV